MSDPYVRDINTINANPNLASQAPIDSRIILVNIESDDDIDSVIGINITNLNINASNDRRDINKWFLFKISAIIAEIEHTIIIVLYEFISIYLYNRFR